jgi:hypothetical protein
MTDKPSPEPSAIALAAAEALGREFDVGTWDRHDPYTASPEEVAAIIDREAVVPARLAGRIEGLEWAYKLLAEYATPGERIWVSHCRRALASEIERLQGGAHE